MRRLAVTLLLVVLVATSSVIVWPVGPASAGEYPNWDLDPIGPVDGGVVSCKIATLADEFDGTTYSYAVDYSTAVARCYVDNTQKYSAGGSAMTALQIANIQAYDTSGALRAPFGSCDPLETSVAEGYVSAVCYYSGGSYDYDSFRGSVYVRAQFGTTNWRQMTPTATGAIDSNTGEVTNGTAFPLRASLDPGDMDPGWPSWWPAVGATPQAPEGDNTPLPEVICRVQQRVDPTEGTVYADFRAAAYPGTYGESTDEFEWVFEWDDGVSTPRGEPSTPSWWEGRTVHETDDGSVLSVVVPAAGMPADGWRAVVRMRRLYASEVYTTVDSFEERWEPLDYPGPIDGFTVFGHRYGYDRFEVEGRIAQPDVIAWEAVTVPCSVTVDRSRAGSPEGNDEEVIRRPPDDGLADEDDEAPEAGGCEAPSGWGTLNPIGWAGYAACEVSGGLGDLLSDLLGAIGDLLSAIAGLAGDILDGLVGLLVPDDPWSARMDELEEALDESGAGDLLGGVSEIGDGLGDGMGEIEAGAEACEGPAFEYAVPDGGGGYDIEEVEPFGSCSGSMQSARTGFRLVVSGVFGFGAFVACYNMLARRVGWDTIGGAKEDEA